MTAHSPARTTYLTTFAILMVLLIFTVAVSFLHLGRWSLPAALAIAGLKIVMIAFIFMHLREEPPLVRIFAASGLLWLLIMTVLASCDYLTRNTVIPAAAHDQISTGTQTLPNPPSASR